MVARCKIDQEKEYSRNCRFVWSSCVVKRGTQDVLFGCIAGLGCWVRRVGAGRVAGGQTSHTKGAVALNLRTATFEQ